ncbi:MAG: hypothetical protein ACRYG2_15450, partial [Janthinobacterium lividum]
TWSPSACTRSSRATSTPSPPAPNVAHPLGAERLELVVLEVAVGSSPTRRQASEDGPLHGANVALPGLVSHVTASTVSDVCTFVRDVG